MMFAYNDLFRKHLKTQKIPLSQLSHVRAENVWEMGRKQYSINDVLKNPKKYAEDIERIKNANMDYPILMNSDRTILDGYHRLAKAMQNKKKSINAIIYEPKTFAKFKIAKTYAQAQKIPLDDYMEQFFKNFCSEETPEILMGGIANDQPVGEFILRAALPWVAKTAINAALKTAVKQVTEPYKIYKNAHKLAKKYVPGYPALTYAVEEIYGKPFDTKYLKPTLDKIKIDPFGAIGDLKKPSAATDQLNEAIAVDAAKQSIKQSIKPATVVRQSINATPVAASITVKPK